MFQREYDRRLRIAFVGGGGHAYRTLLPAMAFLPADVRAICVRSDIERAERTAAQYGCRAYTSLDHMFTREDIDAAIVCLPPRQQGIVAAELLRRKVHVWIEKPPGVSSGQVRTLLRLRRDRVVMVGFKKAFMPASVKAREVALSPDYGNLKTILAIYPVSLPSRIVTERSASRVSDWIISGVHPVSFLVSIAAKPVSVRAIRTEEGHGAVCIRFADGVIGTVHLAAGSDPMEMYFLFGDSWHLEMRNNNRVTLSRAVRAEYSKDISFVPPGSADGSIVWEVRNSQARLSNMPLFTQGIHGSLSAFFDGVLENRTHAIGSLEFALDVMAVCEAANRSDGDEVQLPRRNDDGY